MTTYTSSGYGAIALGALCSAGTAGILLKDIQHTGFALDHALSIIVLVVTIGSAVMAVRSMREGHLIEAGVLALLAALGTWYCMTATAGRTAETRLTATLAATSNNGGRERAQAAYDKAVAELAVAKARLQTKRDAKECSICKAEKLAVDDAQTAVNAADAKLQAAPAPVPVNAKIENVAAIIKLVPSVTASQTDVERALGLIDPNLVAIILELGSIVLWHIGLTRRRPPPVVQAPAFADIEAPAPPQPPPPGDRDELPAHRKQREAREKVVSFVDAYRREHGRDPEPREVRAATGLPRATAWRYQRAAV